MDDSVKENTVGAKDANSNGCVNCQNRIEEDKKTFWGYWGSEIFIFFSTVAVFFLTEAFMTGGFSSEGAVLDYSTSIINENGFEGFSFTIVSYVIVVGVISILSHLLKGKSGHKNVRNVIIEISRYLGIFGALIAGVILSIVCYNTINDKDPFDTYRFLLGFCIVSIISIVISGAVKYCLIEKTHILKPRKQ
ncbi:hypothetical protein [Cobetia amphilecti]|uniref:hypothetical protein n=1 Tax=Cobetia amphilecti TaxID=1055104 RepID=UPI00244C1B85|nr:hypothetical protein [Cobetia litoralis]MDH2420244.1 hypothetical protein [Cobetia litoralis]MDH2422359.1 hypothetical protein [Cobetia litoralis]